MPVYEASYRPWEERGGRRASVTFAIAGTMVRRILRFTLVRWLLYALVGAAVLGSTLVFYFSHDVIVQEIQRRLGLQQLDFLHWCNRVYLMVAFPFCVVVAALTGSPLVAEDRRARSLPLYFSRPVTHLQYVAGKLLAVAFFLALVLLLPPLFMYAVDSGMADDASAWGTRFPGLLHSLLPAATTVLLLSTLSLAGSALTERPRYAAFVFLAFFMLVPLVSWILARKAFHDSDWLALSPWRSIQRLAHEVMPMPRKARIDPDARTLQISLNAALGSLGGWTGLGIATIFLKIRRVEVVT